MLLSPFLLPAEWRQKKRVVTVPVVTEGQDLVFQGKVADRDPQDVCNPAEAPLPARPTKSPQEVVQGRGELVPEREHKVKPGWTGTQGTAGTVCVGPGHHFVASTSREVKHHCQPQNS